MRKTEGKPTLKKKARKVEVKDLDTKKDPKGGGVSCLGCANSGGAMSFRAR